ncbi:MAG TPA: hypothetical protein VGR87_16315 [Candidatus Limnocylindria bacterium]|nr:hypothetical protein [Candidatus Limnocylindria bacterium]
MQIRVALPTAAHLALSELSSRERRDARDQAALLIIEALARRRMVARDGLSRPADDHERGATRMATR